MKKIYVIGIGENALETINKTKEKYSNVNTVLFTDKFSSIESKNIDYNIPYDYSFNGFSGRGYEGIATDLLDSVKDEINDLSNKIESDDKVIIFNDLINTGSLEIFYYLCETLGKQINNCYILFNEGYRFQGEARLKYNKLIVDKIYQLNFKIYEIDGDELSKIKKSDGIIDRIEVTYNEFYNYIESIIKGDLI